VSWQPGGVEELQHSLPGKSGPWSPSETLRTGTGSCLGSGNVWWPQWDPAGGSVLALMSRDAQGLSGLDRLDAEWELWRFTDDFSKGTTLVRGIYDARTLAPSPDGRFIVYSGEDKDGEPGVWMWSSHDGRQLLLRQTAESVSWAPEGCRLVVVTGNGIKILSDIAASC
jgi:hypothetical protein